MSAVEHRRTRVPGLIDSKALPGEPEFPSLTGLVLRLNTDSGLWQDAGKSTPAGDGDSLYTWEDQSGNGNDFVQSDAGCRPTVRADISGTIDAVEFDGTSDYMTLGSALYGSSSATVFLVVYLSSTSEQGSMFGVGNNTDGWKIGVGNSSFDNSGNNLIILFDNVKWIATGHAIGTGVHLITVRLTSGAPAWWIDGVSKGNTTGSPYSPSASTWIGADGAAWRYYTDHLIEIVASSSSVSDSEREEMESYLMGKYDI